MATRVFGTKGPTIQPDRPGEDVSGTPVEIPQTPAPPEPPIQEPADPHSSSSAIPASSTTTRTGPVDPADLESKQEERRRYQREWKRRRESQPPGERTAPKSKPKSATQTTLDLKQILLSLHLMGAALLKKESLVITEHEAKRLADAFTRVSELYDVPLMDEKTRAWLNLGMAGVEVYGSRAAAAILEARKKPPQPAQAQPTPGQPQKVEPIRPQAHQGFSA